MRDVNIPLRTAYRTALAGITYLGNLVPAVYGFLTAEEADTYDNYITFGSISHNDASTKSSNDTATSMRVSIYTRSNGSNSGNAADTIAGFVLAALYPTASAKLDLSAFDLQVLDTELTSDITTDETLDANRSYITRNMVFRHNVFHL